LTGLKTKLLDKNFYRLKKLLTNGIIKINFNKNVYVDAVKVLDGNEN